MGAILKKEKIFFTTLLFTLLVLISQSSSFAKTDTSEITNKPKIERHFVFDTIPLNLEEITNSAGLIFSGVCTDKEEIENDPESNLPVYKYTFQVIEAIKGLDPSEKEVTFKQWKPTVKGAGYDIGEKYILFLYPKSNLGLTSPVGYLQGQFEIETSGLLFRKEVVSNKVKNLGLSRNLRTQKKINIQDDEYLNYYLHKCSEGGIPMRYKEFVKIVRHLIEKES